MSGLSTTGSISLGCAFVAGRKRVPRPAAGKTALRTRFVLSGIVLRKIRQTAKLRGAAKIVNQSPGIAVCLQKSNNGHCVKMIGNVKREREIGYSNFGN